MRSFQENIAKLEAVDTQVLRVGRGQPLCQQSLCRPERCAFPLLSDFGGKVAADYGNSFLINDLNFRKSRFRSLNIRLPAAVILLEARLKAESSSRNARTGDR